MILILIASLLSINSNLTDITIKVRTEYKELILAIYDYGRDVFIDTLQFVDNQHIRIKFEYVMDEGFYYLMFPSTNNSIEFVIGKDQQFKVYLTDNFQFYGSKENEWIFTKGMGEKGIPKFGGFVNTYLNAEKIINQGSGKPDSLNFFFRSIDYNNH